LKTKTIASGGSLQEIIASNLSDFIN